MKTKRVKIPQTSIKTVMRNSISDIEHWKKRKDQTLARDTRFMFYTNRLNERKEDPGYCCGLSIYIYRCPRKS